MGYKLKYENVCKSISDYGYTLISEDIIDSKSKIDILCPYGHIFPMSWNRFNAGQRCPICNKNNQRHTYEHVRGVFKLKGYDLLSDNYVNDRTPLDVRCPNGHLYKVDLNNFRSGLTCTECSNTKRHTYERVKEYIESFGYRLISTEYRHILSKLTIECDNNHNYNASFDSFKHGKRCPKCRSNMFSKKEKELLSYIKSICSYNIIENDRTIVTNPKTGRKLELDIWIPDKLLAIEFNGSFWHSSEYSKFKDKVKIQKCKEANIKLLVIEEDAWMKNKEKCLNRIRDFVIG